MAEEAITNAQKLNEKEIEQNCKKMSETENKFKGIKEILEEKKHLVK